MDKINKKSYQEDLSIPEEDLRMMEEEMKKEMEDEDISEKVKDIKKTISSNEDEELASVEEIKKSKKKSSKPEIPVIEALEEETPNEIHESENKKIETIFDEEEESITNELSNEDNSAEPISPIIKEINADSSNEENELENVKRLERKIQSNPENIRNITGYEYVTNDEDLKISKTELEVNDILKNISYDPSKVEIIKPADYSQLDLLKNDKYFKKKAVRQVILPQSYYCAYMSGFSNMDISSILESSQDEYSNTKNLYEKIFAHIDQSSIGQMKFNEFLRETSYFDSPTLLYGIYCQTFPNINEYDLNCVNPKCRSKFKVKIPNGALPVILGDKLETIETMRDILKSTSGNISKAKEIKRTKGLVHKIIRVGLDDSKMIFNIRIPSLEDHLKDSLENMKEELIKTFSSKNIALLMFIDSILVPNIHYYKETGKLAFFEVSDRAEVLQKFSDLSIDDSLKVQHAINDLIEKHAITYKIQSAECPYCGHIMKDIEIEISSFFIRTIQMQTEKLEESNNSTEV